MKLTLAAVWLLLVASGVRRTDGSEADSVASTVVESKCGTSFCGSVLQNQDASTTLNRQEGRSEYSTGTACVNASQCSMRILTAFYHRGYFAGYNAGCSILLLLWLYMAGRSASSCSLRAVLPSLGLTALRAVAAFSLPFGGPSESSGSLSSSAAISLYARSDSQHVFLLSLLSSRRFMKV